MLEQKLFLSLWLLSFLSIGAGHVVKARVAILGGGMAGITAARTLHEQGIQDFVIIEGRSELGGRMQNGAFKNGLKIEFGPNWIQGLGGATTQLNPIYAMALKNELDTIPSDYGNLTTYDHNGPANMVNELFDVHNGWSQYLMVAEERMNNELADLSARAGFRLAGYKPRTHLDDAAEYFTFDYEYGQSPEVSSFFASANNNNYTFNGFSNEANLVIDQRGFKTILQSEATSFLNISDTRVFLNHVVTNIHYSREGVHIETNQNITIQAEYALCTFSIGVLQNDDVTFHPTLPFWKQDAIHGTNMATYTKIFLRFNTTFWAPTQFQLYADPGRRGYYSSWQSLDLPGFFPGSHVLFVTVTDRESIRIERQPDATTQDEMMDVLRSMYGQDIPEPEEILFKRWDSDPLFRGSYSNWGASFPPELFVLLREPVEQRLWFAGEGTSDHYYGFLHGAYFEGVRAATSIVQCLHTNCPISDMIYSNASSWKASGLASKVKNIF
ncbi:amine oxidase [Hysterangium stoloniferum]|nr:amine oxidase [Hysterangium stoloniferum]